MNKENKKWYILILCTILICYFAQMLSMAILYKKLYEKPVLETIELTTNIQDVIEENSIVSNPDVSTTEQETTEKYEKKSKKQSKTSKKSSKTEQKEVKTTKNKYYKVPLNKDIQDHIFKLCDKHKIEPSLVIAIIFRESNYNPNLQHGNIVGLMQINNKYTSARMKRLNCSNLLDPYDNITVGIDILREHFSYGKPVEWVLMAYNGGVEYANKKYNNGEVSDYAKNVLSTQKKLERA